MSLDLSNSGKNSPKFLKYKSNIQEEQKQDILKRHYERPIQSGQGFW